MIKKISSILVFLLLIGCTTQKQDFFSSKKENFNRSLKSIPAILIPKDWGKKIKTEETI